MTEKNIILLSLIEKGLPTTEICAKLNISVKQLKTRLESIRNAGFNIDKKYNYNGTINYFLNKEVLSEINSNTATIDLDDQKKFQMVAIADTHYGHVKSNMKYAHQIYEYCAKNNIHIVVHCGDFLDCSPDSELSHEDQLYRFLKEYPINSEVLTFIALGNHEDVFLRDFGYNLNTIINKEREDLISLGYNRSEISVANNKIFVSHKGNFNEEYGLKLKGHSHRYKFSARNHGVLITVPTLSDFLHTTDYPGAVDISIGVDRNKHFYNLEARHLIINNNEVKEVSAAECYIKKGAKNR